MGGGRWYFIHTSVKHNIGGFSCGSPKFSCQPNRTLLVAQGGLSLRASYALGFGSS